MATSAEKEILGVRSRASDEIAKRLRSIHDRDYYSVLGDFFEASAISVKNAVDLNDREVYEKRFADIAKSYGEKGMKIFAECLSLFTDEIHAAIHGNAMFRDFAGELYMASGTNSKGLGQFFTPYHVSRLMAECNLEKDRFIGEIEENPDRVITFYEPTCGAGGLMVAAIDVMHSAGINYAHNMFIDCGDIDPRCFHMSYLTLSLLGAPAVVRLGDALSMKYHRAWFTPAYIFNWPHFRKELNGGKLDSYPVTPTKHASPDNKVETEIENERTETITIGEQLSLF
ncbi:MAG: N-6 DNA methylase [Bacteroidaceae bacterium]|nr:N-6 DNA methylase [Fibrobacter sp.]MBR2863067.1 N-6 DNA methylase [Bacteroidaceae bacterium]MBR6317269.1 N-6 DNA methylase [Fibrobacter sp.]